MRKLNKADSNRGGALLSVIIAMAVVGILGALIISISYTNFRMKQIDKNSTDNFYSAEGVLDEICVGLQQEVSNQYKKAYTTVMENYGNYASSEVMGDDFNTQFVLNMVGALQSSISDTEHYNLDKIMAYVNASNYPSSDEYTVSSIVKSSVTGADGTTTYVYDNLLETLKDGLCIRNLVVTYKDRGYVNTITTDIKISTPGLAFSMISTMPEIADYSFIAQDGLATQTGAHWSLSGKAFAGTGIDINSGSAFDATDVATTLLVTGGDINVESGSVFSTATTTSLWANSVTATATTGSTVGNNAISLLGRTYIKDDTTLNGSGNTLTVGGQYYGYSNNDSDASESSAIIINGSASTLDMSDLEAMVIAGTSFVATKADNSETNSNATTINTADVLMGDSIAVKGNQIAYMVPIECRGITANPMSYAQYGQLIQNTNWEADALGTTLPSLRRSLASYGSISIQPVYTARDGGTVYLYLSFSDADIASKYYMDYYGGAGGAKMREYLNRYVSVFKFNSTDMNRLVAQGNYLVPATTTTGTYVGNTGDVATTAQELANYKSSFEALCAKLVENKSSLTSIELGQTVYQNLVDQEVLEWFMDECAANASTANWSDNITYSSTGGMEIATIWVNKDELTLNSGVRCILVDNDDETDTAYTVPTGGSGIIIATGDVVLNANASVAWDGLIICNGNMLLSGGTSSYPISLRADADATSKAMQFMCSVGAKEISESTPEFNYAVLNFFIGGSEFSLGSASDAEGAKVDVRDCLSFENWKSE